VQPRIPFGPVGLQQRGARLGEFDALAAPVGFVGAARFTGLSPLEGYLATSPGGVYAVLATAVEPAPT
jgi:hypothetical protein